VPLKVKKDEVEKFIEDFYSKLKVFDIIFENRDKNNQALFDLDITPLKRFEYINKLKPENYLSGPNQDTNDPTRPNYWEFGIKVKNTEVYIKINIGFVNKPVICISFHIAERKISYPFKSKKNNR